VAVFREFADGYGRTQPPTMSAATSHAAGRAARPPGKVQSCPAGLAQVGRVAPTRGDGGVEEEAVVEGASRGLAVDEGIAVGVDAAVEAARHAVGIDHVAVAVGVEADATAVVQTHDGRAPAVVAPAVRGLKAAGGDERRLALALRPPRAPQPRARVPASSW